MSRLQGLSPDVASALGWTLVHSLWQGAALVAAAAIAMSLCRKASSRYLVGLVALALMLVGSTLTFSLFRSSSAGEPVEARALTELQAVFQGQRLATDQGLATDQSLSPSPGLTPNPRRDVSTNSTLDHTAEAPDFLGWAAYGWLLGVSLFSLRTAGGLVYLSRMRRRHSEPLPTKIRRLCLDLEQRLGIRRIVRYATTRTLESPVVIGWIRPLVLLPISAATGLSEQQLRLVLAHELAHIKRFDPFVNLLQSAVEILFFYHPGAWWLSRRIRTEREYCCDDVALALGDQEVEYARALAQMEAWRQAPTLAMAANRHPLAARVARILGTTTPTQGAPGLRLGIGIGVLCLFLALGAGDVLFGLAQEDPDSEAPTHETRAEGEGEGEERETESTPRQNSAQDETLEAGSQEARSQEARSQEARPRQATPNGGVSEWSSELRSAFRVHGVTTDFVRKVRDEGLDPDGEDLIAFAVHGVTPEFIRELKQAGLTLTRPEQVIAAKIHGVRPEFVRSLTDLGFVVTAEEAVSLRIHGAEPELFEALSEEGLMPSVKEVLSLRIQRVTPEFIRAVKAEGIEPEPKKLLAMKVHRVTPEYIAGLRQLGFDLSLDQIVAAKIHNLSLEFIARAHELGFDKLDIDKLRLLKQLGVVETAG